MPNPNISVGSGLQDLFSCQINTSAFSHVSSSSGGTVTEKRVAQTSFTTLSSQSSVVIPAAETTGDDDMDISNSHLSALKSAPVLDKENLQAFATDFQQGSQENIDSTAGVNIKQKQLKNIFPTVNFEGDDGDSPKRQCIDVLNQTRIDDDSDMSMSSTVLDFTSHTTNMNLDKTDTGLLNKSLKFLNQTMDLTKQHTTGQINCSIFAPNVTFNNSCLDTTDVVSSVQLNNSKNSSNHHLLETTKPGESNAVAQLETNANSLSLFDPPQSHTGASQNEKPSFFESTNAETSMNITTGKSFLLGVPQTTQFGLQFSRQDSTMDITNQKTFTGPSTLGFSDEDIASGNWTGANKSSNMSNTSTPGCNDTRDILNPPKPVSFFCVRPIETTKYIPEDDVFSLRAAKELISRNKSNSFMDFTSNQPDVSTFPTQSCTIENVPACNTLMERSCSPNEMDITQGAAVGKQTLESPSVTPFLKQASSEDSSGYSQYVSVRNKLMEISNSSNKMNITQDSTVERLTPKSPSALQANSQAVSCYPKYVTLSNELVETSQSLNKLDITSRVVTSDISPESGGSTQSCSYPTVVTKEQYINKSLLETSSDVLSSALQTNVSTVMTESFDKNKSDMNFTAKQQEFINSSLPLNDSTVMDTSLQVDQDKSLAVEANVSTCMSQDAESPNKTKHMSEMDITNYAHSQETLNVSFPSNTLMEMTVPVNQEKSLTQESESTFMPQDKMNDMDITGYAKPQENLDASLLSATSMDTTLPVDQETSLSVETNVSTIMSQDNAESLNKTKHVSDMDITNYASSQEMLNVSLTSSNTVMETILPVNREKSSGIQASESIAESLSKTDMDITSYSKLQDTLNKSLLLGSAAVETSLKESPSALQANQLACITQENCGSLDKTQHGNDMDITGYAPTQSCGSVDKTQHLEDMDITGYAQNCGSLDKTQHLNDMDITGYARTQEKSNLSLLSTTSIETSMPGEQEKSMALELNVSTCMSLDSAESLNKTKLMSDMDITNYAKSQEGLNVFLPLNTSMETTLPVDKAHSLSINQPTTVPPAESKHTDIFKETKELDITKEVKSTIKETTELDVTKVAAYAPDCSGITQIGEVSCIDENYKLATKPLTMNIESASEETDKANKRSISKSPEVDKNKTVSMDITTIANPDGIINKSLPPDELNKTSCVDNPAPCTDFSLTLSQPTQENNLSQIMDNSFEVNPTENTDVSSRSMNQTFVVQTSLRDAKDNVVFEESHTKKYGHVSTPNVNKSVNYETTYTQNNLINEKCDIKSLKIVENIRANNLTADAGVTKFHITDDVEDVLIGKTGEISHKIKHFDLTKTVETSPLKETKNMSVSTQINLNSSQELFLSLTNEQVANVIEFPNTETSPLKSATSTKLPSPEHKTASGEFKRSSEWLEENVNQIKKSCQEKHQIIPKITITSSTPPETIDYSSPKSSVSESVDMELDHSPNTQSNENYSDEVNTVTCDMDVIADIISPHVDVSVKNIPPGTDDRKKDADLDINDLNEEAIISQQVLAKKRKSGTHEIPVVEELVVSQAEGANSVAEDSEPSPRKLIKLSPAKDIALTSMKVEEPSKHEGPFTITEYIMELSKSTQNVWRVVLLEPQQWKFGVLQGSTHLCIDFAEDGSALQVVFTPNTKAMEKLLKGPALSWQFCLELLNRRFPGSVLLELCSCKEKIPDLLDHLSPVLTSLSSLGRGLAHSATTYLMEFSFKSCCVKFSAWSTKLLLTMRVRLDLSNWEEFSSKYVSVHVIGGNNTNTSPIPGLLINLPHDWQMIPKYIEEVREYVKVLEQFISKN